MGTQRRFPPKYIDKTFWLSKALLDLYKCILSGAIKILSFRSSQGNVNLSKLQGLQYIIFLKILKF